MNQIVMFFLTLAIAFVICGILVSLGDIKIFYDAVF